ncbi:MAG: tetratricopeptide repeat protein [Bacteroidetes bacterium]|nr:tetratricopeptide repeat protein [Bacteroidota bacterium]
MKHKILLFLFNFLTCFLVYGNTAEDKTDSLLHLLSTSEKDDTNRVKTALAISEEFCNTSPGKAHEYAEMALSLSENLHWEKGVAASLFLLGNICDDRGDLSSALEYRLRDLETRKKLNDRKGMCTTFGKIGNSYYNMGNYSNAMKYYLLSMKIAEETGNKEQAASNLCNIANVFNNEGNIIAASEYYDKSLKLAEEYGYERIFAMNHGNLGNLMLKERHYSEALKHCFIAIEYYNKIRDQNNIASLLGNIGGIYQMQSDSANDAGNNNLRREKNNKALECYYKALKAAEELGNNYLKATFLGNLGAIYLTEKYFVKAEEFLQKSLDLAQSINAIDEIQIDYQRFYELYKQMHLHGKALEYHEKFIALKDSIFSENNKKIISELQIKYETEKKESKNKVLARQNEMQALKIANNLYVTAGLVILLFFVVFISVLFFRQNKMKSRQKVMQYEQKLLRTQMNPHFIFNSLASIESFIYEHQPKEAGMYLSRFARLMRLILETSAREYTTLDKEIEVLEHYFSLQKMRLNDNLEYSIEVAPSIIPEQTYLPPMLTQPFIENAIEHGFRGMVQKGSVHIAFRKEGNNMEVQITDNGIGMANAQQQEGGETGCHHKPLAIQITKERLRFLNKSKKQKLDFAVADVKEEKGKSSGTKITFTIPLS